jgi:triosephosphate isomerase (TIM)
MRKKFICGNWKMHKTGKDALLFMKKFRPSVKNVKNTEIIIAAPFTLLPLLKEKTKDTKIKVSAQNVFYEEEGAFTGEESPKMIKEFADFVIIGHSERRRYFNETDDIVNKKIKAALKEKLKVIFCLGETLEERNKKMTEKVVENQLNVGLKDISASYLKNIVIAYEPVWAIGTGKNATPEQAEEVHLFLRKLIQKSYGKKSAEEIRIIYGGSVNPENSKEILKMKNVDGCLPGGASLDPIKLETIIKSL